MRGARFGGVEEAERRCRHCDCLCIVIVVVVVVVEDLASPLELNVLFFPDVKPLHERV